MSEFEISLSLPLDSERFLRRACPSCCQEFKWLPGEAYVPTSSSEFFFCPYCGEPAAPSDWFTVDQLAYINAEVLNVAVLPSLEGLTESFDQLARSTGGLIQITGGIDVPVQQQAAPVFEPNDMKRVTFSCHTSEPVKVQEEWQGPVHCLCCGRLSDATP